MATGRIDVLGDVGHEAGMAMAGGILHVSGNAGDRFCAAAPGASKGMTGGEAIVLASAGREAGARARRGLIVVGGDTGPQAARDIIAGTVIVLGRTGADPGLGSKRGSIVAVGGIDVPSTYQYACTYEPPYVRLVMTYLRRSYELAIGDEVVTGGYRRYCGDAGDPGKGEILVRIGH
jgi:formylmethanofuran dehydrogenase subunit C